MLTEFLRSFTLPGLEKKYIVADESLTEEGAAADSKKVGEELAKKVDKETGKALSTNDYTNAEKTKLAGVDDGAQVNTIEGVKVDGTEVTPDAQKKVNLDVYDKAAINAIVQEIYAEVAKKLNIDGYSEAATVGNALGLVTDSVVEDKEPYNFRSLAHLPVGKFCYDTIVGGSVVWNQLMKTSGSGGIKETRTVDGITFTNNGDGSLTLNGTATKATSININNPITYPYNHTFFIYNSGFSNRGNNTDYITTIGQRIDNGGGGIHRNGTTYNASILRFEIANGSTYNNVKIYPIVIDLTSALPPTIADYIYSLERTTAGAGVAWFKKYFPGIYYGYCEPHFEHVQTSAKETVGFNRWDEVWELGDINSDGSNHNSSGRLRSKNHIPAFPETVYYMHVDSSIYPQSWYGLFFYDENKQFISTIAPNVNRTFTTPTGTRYIRFYLNDGWGGKAYTSGICVNLHGDRDGEYEPYNKRTYPLDSSLTLRGIPKLDSANRLYFDGDIYRHDGSGERRYAENELSDLSYEKQTVNGTVYFMAKANSSFTVNGDQKDVRCWCSVYSVNETTSSDYFPTNNEMALWNAYAGGGKRIIIRDDSVTTVADLKTKLVGKGQILSNLKTPIDFTAEPFQYPMVVDPLGTEEFVDYAVEQGERDVKIPCGHTSEYPEDLVDKLEVLPHATGTNGDYLITEIDGKLYLKPYTQTVGLTSVSETEAE